MPPEHMQNSLGCLCLRVQHGIPSRPERKKRPLYVLPTHPLAVANRPLPCNVGGVGISCLNKKGTIFSHRETCPQFGSAGNQHCMDWGCGGAARRGWRGRFFRSGRTRVRWCCTAIFVCVCVCESVVWSMDAVVFVRHDHKQRYGGTRWLRCPQQRPNARFVAWNSSSDNRPCWYHSTARARSAIRLDSGTAGAPVELPGIMPSCCSPMVAATSAMNSSMAWLPWRRHCISPRSTQRLQQVGRDTLDLRNKP